MKLLEIIDLHVAVEGKEILRGVNLVVNSGEITALMGPNGSGKSTLAYVLMGHPKYIVTKGRILVKGQDIKSLSPDERAKLGMFLSFQYPMEITGVTLSSFLRTALNELSENKISVPEFDKLIKGKMQDLGMNTGFANRYLNEGFSGGEKKRAEILQMSILKPELAILDETDSGLDIDALKAVAEGINAYLKLNPAAGALVITHYQRLLDYLKPNSVCVMVSGKIVKQGGSELVAELEKKGYDWLGKKIELKKA